MQTNCHFLIASLLLCLFSNSNITSQEQSTDYVPKEAFGAILLDLESLGKTPGAEYFPHEIVDAMGKRDYGIQISEIASAKMIFGINDAAPQNSPEMGATIELKKPRNLAERFEEIGPSTVVDGEKIFFDTNLQMHFLQPSPKTLLLASSEPFVVLMAASKNVRNPFTRLLAKTGTERSITAILSVEKLKGLLGNLLTSFPAPPPFGAANRLPELTQSIEISTDLMGSGLDMSIQFVGYGEKGAGQIQKILKQMLALGKAAALTAMAAQTDSDDLVSQAQYAYAARIADKLEKDLAPERKDNTVTIRFESEVATVGVMTALLLPAVQAAREAARRTQSANNLRQIGLSLFHHLDTQGRFPPQAITDRKGKKLLSWRVQVLPYLGYQELYDSFHFDEPWDSEHNIKLLEQMPPIYRNPNSAEETTTNFLAVTGKGTAFDGKTGRKINEFRDGTSKGILTVEADKYVPWTQPVDFEVDWENPVSGLGNIRPGIFQAGMADGSSIAIAISVDPELLKSMFRIQDGK
ncbi:MAG: DUF1559 domain-containing protein [Planctomycetota bacterium]|nr:DUF1559 domain-containing protein [Planctomycetota bacterium]